MTHQALTLPMFLDDIRRSFQLMNTYSESLSQKCSALPQLITDGNRCSAYASATPFRIRNQQIVLEEYRCDF